MQKKGRDDRESMTIMQHENVLSVPVQKWQGVKQYFFRRFRRNTKLFLKIFVRNIISLKWKLFAICWIYITIFLIQRQNYKYYWLRRKKRSIDLNGGGELALQRRSRRH